MTYNPIHIGAYQSAKTGSASAPRERDQNDALQYRSTFKRQHRLWQPEPNRWHRQRIKSKPAALNTSSFAGSDR